MRSDQLGVGAVIEWGASVAVGAEVLQYAVVRQGVRIGEGTRICSHVYIDVGVQIGARCKIKNFCGIFSGTVIEDEVFVGPGVQILNDPWPRATEKRPDYPGTLIRRGASIGARSVILPGVIVGEFAMIGAGSVVTKDIPAHALAFGNPCRVKVEQE